MEAPPLLNAPPGRRRWWLHLLLITAYILVIGIVGMGRTSGHHAPALLHTARGLLLVCGVELLIFGAVFGLACRASRATGDELRLRWRGSFLPAILGIGYSVGLRMALGILSAAVVVVLIAVRVVSPQSLQNYVVANQPDVKSLVDLTAMHDNPAYYWLAVTVVSFVVAGLREELWRSAFLAGMRGLWPQYFSSTLGQVGAVLIGAVLFGSAHLAMGIMAAVAAGLLGVGLGLIMVFHRSIWPAVIAHGMFDATTFALLPWVVEFTKHGV